MQKRKKMPRNVNDLPHLTSNYIWQEPFWAALIELDIARMQAHVRKARRAMSKRLKDLAAIEPRSAMLEYNAIQDAEVLLTTLERNAA